MKRSHAKRRDHEAGSTNVYADLGYKNPEDMLVRAQLVSRITELLRERNITQTRVAALLGIPQPKLSELLRGQFRGFSGRKLIGCLTRLGQAKSGLGREDDRALFSL